MPENHQEKQTAKLQDKITLLENNLQKAEQKLDDIERNKQEEELKQAQQQFEMVIARTARKNKTDEKAREHAKERMKNARWDEDKQDVD